MRSPDRPLTRGEVLSLASADYKFGTLEPMRLEIEAVVEERALDDGLWVEVVGMVLADNGAPVRHRPSTLIRADAIDRSRRSAYVCRRDLSEIAMRPWKRIKWFFDPHDPVEPIRVVSPAMPVRFRAHGDPAWNTLTTRYEAFRLTPGWRARGHGGRWPL